MRCSISSTHSTTVALPPPSTEAATTALAPVCPRPGSLISTVGTPVYPLPGFKILAPVIAPPPVSTVYDPLNPPVAAYKTHPLYVNAPEPRSVPVTFIASPPDVNANWNVSLALLTTK